MADIPYQAGHYHSPINYKNKDELLVAEELRIPIGMDIKDRKKDSLDHLYFSVRNSYNWEFNVKTRLVGDTYVWN